MMWWNNGMGWGAGGTGGWAIMALVVLAFWALVAVGVGALLRDRQRSGRPDRPVNDPSAERILDERFARGEMDADQYHTSMAALRSGH